ncbi:MAG: histidine kinase N-terminal 7TM domain-containing diguanylate cyclase [Candidatus Bipolaricaulaceae bacterium]
MDWWWTGSAAVLFPTGALSLAIAGVLFLRRAIPGARTLGLAMLAVAGWAVVAGLESMAVAVGAKIVLSKLEYVGSGSLGVLFLLFAYHHPGRTGWLSRGRRAALWALPAASVGLAATNEHHQLVWRGFSAGPAGSNALIYHHGPAFFAITAWVYAFVLLGASLLIWQTRRASAVQRRQSAPILAATAFPFVGGLMYAMGITLIPGLNLTPVTFAAAGVVLAVSIVPLRLFELVPVARELLIERMSDGVVVVDSARRVVDVNPAARQLLTLPPGIIGADAAEAVAAWPRIAPSFHPHRESHFEVTLAEEPLMHVDFRVVPLRGGLGRVVGHLVVLRDISERRRAETSLRRVNQRLTAHVQQIERLQEKLREQAIRDALTGLVNRRYLDETLPRVLGRAAREEVPVSIIMFDIDRFKQVNDAHGHRVGDGILAELGRLLAAETRPGDIACRLGGEEFVVVLPGAPVHVAAERADVIRKAFQAAAVSGLGQREVVSLSAGVAVFPRDGVAPADLLHAADGALHRAKEAGRNRVRTTDGQL